MDDPGGSPKLHSRPDRGGQRGSDQALARDQDRGGYRRGQDDDREQGSLNPETAHRRHPIAQERGDRAHRRRDRQPDEDIGAAGILGRVECSQDHPAPSHGQRECDHAAARGHDGQPEQEARNASS